MSELHDMVFDLLEEQGNLATLTDVEEVVNLCMDAAIEKAKNAQPYQKNIIKAIASLKQE